MHGVGSRNKLTPSHRRLYPGSSLLDEIGRVLCGAGCLPRKELHEAWEMACRVRAQQRGGRVVDLCCGFGLLAQLLLILDDTSPGALAVDVRLPANHTKVHAALARAFPVLQGRLVFVQAPLAGVELTHDDLVVSSHACGGLTDDVLARAAAVRARVAVLPCCHRSRRRTDLASFADRTLVMDLERAHRLRTRGYTVELLTIPPDVSPKNRLLLGHPHTS